MARPDEQVLEPTPTQRRSPRLHVLLGLVALIGVLAGGIVGVGLYIHANNHTRDLVQAREDALVAARQLIINLDGLSVATIDQDFQKVDDGSTGEFKKQFGTIQATLKQLVTSRKTKSNSLVLSAAVVRNTLTTAEVLIAEDRTISDNTTTSPAVLPQRWQVKLLRQNGQWLVSGLANVV